MTSKKRNILNLPVKAPQKEPGLIEEGTIGDLKYKVFDRGNIHITDGERTFKKDRKVLKELLSRCKFEGEKVGYVLEIPGAGDTTKLRITKEESDVRLSLGDVMPPTVSKLIKILDI